MAQPHSDEFLLCAAVHFAPPKFPAAGCVLCTRERAIVKIARGKYIFCDIQILHYLPFSVNIFCYTTYHKQVKIVFLYRCIPYRISLPDAGVCLTYGLAALQRTDAGWQTLQLVPDVSVNRALVEELAIRCTVNQLEPCHMEDVIEDALAF